MAGRILVVVPCRVCLVKLYSETSTVLTDGEVEFTPINSPDPSGLRFISSFTLSL